MHTKVWGKHWDQPSSNSSMYISTIELVGRCWGFEAATVAVMVTLYNRPLWEECSATATGVFQCGLYAVNKECQIQRSQWLKVELSN